MKKSKKIPAIFFINSSNADTVRQLAREYNLTYLEEIVKDHPEAVKFVFSDLTESKEREFIFSIPSEAHYFLAIIDNDRPPAK